MFGRQRRDDVAGAGAVAAEIARLRALAIEQVAAEVMTRTFGPRGPAVDGAIRVQSITDVFLPTAIRKQIHRREHRSVAHHGLEGYRELEALVRDATWLLEQHRLVVFHCPRDGAGETYRVTRSGIEALASDAVERAVREPPR
jgi:hypothetical protein